MATGKSSFVLYVDIIHTVRKLPKDKVADLFLTILAYVNDENPKVDDPMVDIVFEPIKQQLKRDLKKWEKTLKKKSEGGKKGMAARWKKDKIVKDPITTDNIVKESITTITDNVNVNDTVTVNVNERENTGSLANSNLNRKPFIPTKQQVLEAIVNAGGDKVMAKSFYEKHQGTGWYINGSPIVDYTSLASRFVSTWKDIDKGKPQTDENYNPNGHIKKL